MTPSDNRPGKSKNYYSKMMLLTLLLFLFSAWMLYDRLSIHLGVASVEIIPQAKPVALTRPTMPKPTRLPSELEVPKSTETETAAKEPQKTAPARQAKADAAALSATRVKPAKTKKPGPPEPAKPKKTVKAAAVKETKPSSPAKVPGPAVASPPSAPKPKTQRVDFEYSDPEADSVLIDGSFLMWKPRAMKRDGNSWRTNLYIFPGKYRYHFIVDGKKILDPLQPLKQNEESYLIVVPQ